MRVNIQADSARRIVILMGHDKYIMRGFDLDNIQLTGGWYLEDTEHLADELKNVIVSHGIECVDFVGSSKSNTGSFILAKKLSDLMPGLGIKIFAFTPFTTLEENYYIAHGIADRAPGTLKGLWRDGVIDSDLARLADASDIARFDKVKVFQFFPYFSNAGEKLLCERVTGSNIKNIPLPVSLHNSLFPFWNEVQDQLLETHEGVFRTMPKEDYVFYRDMQNNLCGKRGIYEILLNTGKFINALRYFSAPYFSFRRKFIT